MTQRKEKIGLYFGSFNPIHIGHLIIADYIVQDTDLDKIWFVVSAQNPLKELSSLADNQTRYQLVQSAIQDNPDFYASDEEFSLPIPSYTVNTLAFFAEKYKDKEFSLIMGQDNLCVFDKWKDYNSILDNYNIYVYPRKGCSVTQFDNHPHVHYVNALLIDISATFIRQRIKQGRSVRYLVCAKVLEQIEKKGLYRQ